MKRWIVCGLLVVLVGAVSCRQQDNYVPPAKLPAIDRGPENVEDVQAPGQPE